MKEPAALRGFIPMQLTLHLIHQARCRDPEGIGELDDHVERGAFHPTLKEGNVRSVAAAGFGELLLCQASLVAKVLKDSAEALLRRGITIWSGGCHHF